MPRYTDILAAALLLFVVVPAARAQQVRSEVALTTERRGASVNVDAQYYGFKNRMFAIGRMFMGEPDEEPAATVGNSSTIAIEVAAGPQFRNGLYIFGPLAGIDSKRRVLAGGNLLTKVRSHTVAYLGYVKIATDPERRNGMRHRVMFDLKKDQKLFLRLDWKTEGARHEHCRLGVEFHRRIDKLNLPIYLEPFWNVPVRQIGIRIGTRL